MLEIGVDTIPVHRTALDTTFEPHYSVGDLARQWRLSRETVRLLIKDEQGVVKIRLGRRKSMTRYSVPESVAASIRSCSIHHPSRMGRNKAEWDRLIALFRLMGPCFVHSHTEPVARRFTQSS